jgi:hypothetical protein
MRLGTGRPHEFAPVKLMYSKLYDRQSTHHLEGNFPFKRISAPFETQPSLRAKSATFGW